MSEELKQVEAGTLPTVAAEERGAARPHGEEMTAALAEIQLESVGFLESLMELESLREESAWLRQQVWLTHGCGITGLYGDDGEMQCGRCLIDFKRGHWEDIKKRLDQMGRDRMVPPA
jgi:hypothetical protein